MKIKPIYLTLVASAMLLLAPHIHSADDSTAVTDSDVEQVLAVSNDIGYGEYLAGECASCHAVNQVAGSNVPKIHGSAANQVARALMEYRTGIRENTTMRSVAGALGDEEIAVLSHYLAQWKP